MAFWDQKNFEMGSLSLGLVSPKFVLTRFAQPHAINIHMWSVSLGLVIPKCIGASLITHHSALTPPPPNQNPKPKTRNPIHEPKLDLSEPLLYFLFIPLYKITPHYVLEGHDGSNISSHTTLEKFWQKMRCELCARACLTDSAFASHFWFLEGVWKPPAGEMPAITNHSVPIMH